MAKRKIFTDDAPCLYKVCRPVERFDGKLSELIDDMAETMYAAEGCGLAASQIGILRRVAVIDCGDGLVELVNPTIVETSGEEGCFEGCLSFPGKSGYVVRPFAPHAFRGPGPGRDAPEEGGEKRAFGSVFLVYCFIFL